MPYLRLTISDTMGFWDDYLSDYIFDPANSKTFINWYRLPADWLDAGALLPARLEQLFAYLYGADWRGGNGDGSKYIVLKIEQHELSDDEIAQRVWMGTNHTCYIVDEVGLVQKVSPAAM